MRRLECRQRTNSDVWIHHVACKFRGFFHKTPTLQYIVIWKQLFISNDKNRVRWVVLGLLQDGACTDLVENLSVNSLKGDLSNATIFYPALFSLVNTFKLWTVPCCYPVKACGVGICKLFPLFTESAHSNIAHLYWCSLLQVLPQS